MQLPNLVVRDFLLDVDFALESVPPFSKVPSVHHFFPRVLDPLEGDRRPAHRLALCENGTLFRPVASKCDTRSICSALLNEEVRFRTDVITLNCIELFCMKPNF